MRLNRKEKHTFLKGVEELNELAVELIHSVNKPQKNNKEKIVGEIKDVEEWIAKIKDILSVLKLNE